MRPSKSPATALKLGQAFGLQHASRRMVVASRDDHPATRVLGRCLISGLLSAGVSVRDLGVCPSPVTRHAAREFASGAVHAHAGFDRGSPFLVEFYDRNGDDVDGATERRLQAALTHDHFRMVLGDAGIVYDSSLAVESYARAARATLSSPATRPCLVVVDYAYGMGSLVLPRLLGGSHYEIVALNSYYDDRLSRAAASNRRMHIRQLGAMIAGLGAALGIFVDPECETFALVDDKGRTVACDAVYPETHLAPDALFGAAKAVHLISEEQRPVSELAQLLAGCRASFEHDLEKLRA